MEEDRKRAEGKEVREREEEREGEKEGRKEEEERRIDTQDPNQTHLFRQDLTKRESNKRCWKHPITLV